MGTSDGFLIKQEKYLEAGIHIGTKIRVIDMRRFIYRTRNDGLYVLDLRKVDERIRQAGKMMAKYEAKDIVVVASRTYSSAAAAKFASITGVKVLSGRFIPGRFTNVSREDFIEPKMLVVCDPKGEHQAVIEAGKSGVPSIGLCDTDNFTTFIDWVIPCNNKGRRSLSLIFWLLAREMAISNGKISSYDDFKPTLEEFEAQEAEKTEGTPAVVGEGAAAAVVAPVSEAPAVEKKITHAAVAEAPSSDDDTDKDEAADNEEDGPEHQAGASVEPPVEGETPEVAEVRKAAARKKAAVPKKEKTAEKKAE